MLQKLLIKKKADIMKNQLFLAKRMKYSEASCIPAAGEENCSPNSKKRRGAMDSAYLYSLDTKQPSASQKSLYDRGSCKDLIIEATIQ